jgi:hypothetical protein
VQPPESEPVVETASVGRVTGVAAGAPRSTATSERVVASRIRM